MAAYGKDIGTDLAELVNRISSIGKDFYLRVGMLEPRNTYDILDNLVDAYRHDNVFKFLHLPVQSAENNVLSAMNREYSPPAYTKDYNKTPLNSNLLKEWSNEIISLHREQMEKSV